MRIFVTGGTGTLGRPTVKLLLERGHEVIALARSDENEMVLGSLGGVPKRADLFDPASLASILSGCDTAIHLATRIPAKRDVLKREAWLENDRLRSEGTRVLVSAALKARVQTIVFPSVTFLYVDCGDRWIDESTAVHAPPVLYSSLLAEAEIERFTSEGGRGIVLRMGALSGPDAPGMENVLDLARKGIAPLIGAKDAYFSCIDVTDAAEAVVAAIDRAPAGIYNVVENEPRTRRDLLSGFARQVGRKHLFRPPVWMIRLFSGRTGLTLARSQRVSNRLFRESTGWAPRHE